MGYNNLKIIKIQNEIVLKKLTFYVLRHVLLSFKSQERDHTNKKHSPRLTKVFARIYKDRTRVSENYNENFPTCLAC